MVSDALMPPCWWSSVVRPVPVLRACGTKKASAEANPTPPEETGPAIGRLRIDGNFLHSRDKSQDASSVAVSCSSTVRWCSPERVLNIPSIMKCSRERGTGKALTSVQSAILDPHRIDLSLEPRNPQTDSADRPSSPGELCAKPTPARQANCCERRTAAGLARAKRAGTSTGTNGKADHEKWKRGVRTRDARGTSRTMLPGLLGMREVFCRSLPISAPSRRDVHVDLDDRLHVRIHAITKTVSASMKMARSMPLRGCSRWC